MRVYFLFQSQILISEGRASVMLKIIEECNREFAIRAKRDIKAIDVIDTLRDINIARRLLRFGSDSLWIIITRDLLNH